MNILWYLLVWALFFGVAFSATQLKENRQLQRGVSTACDEEQFPRRFRSITL